MIQRKLTVVIPARNESASIGLVIQKILDVTAKQKELATDILVVDDSRDATREVASGLGAYVVRGDGRGLGAAMYLGLREALTRFDPEIIAAIDADGQFDPEELPKVLRPILDGKADLALGSRFLQEGLVKYNMPLANRFGNRLLSWLVHRTTGIRITDAQTGFRAMRSEVAQRLDMIGTHTYVQESIIDAAEKNFRIVEVPVKFLPRQHGRSRVVGSIRKYATRSVPILILRMGIYKSFFTIGGPLIILIGVSYGLSVFYQVSFRITELLDRLPALILTTLLIVTGLTIFSFGVLLDLIVSVKYKLDRFEKERWSQGHEK